MGEITPSENEWMIMEIVWEADGPLTAAEIIKRLKGRLKVSDKTVRVMINRLLAKGVLDYEVDPDDSRIYHYHAKRTREECLELKSRRFVDSFFNGDAHLAVASFIKNGNISDEQLEELKRLIDGM